jgi:hypothetical protein
MHGTDRVVEAGGADSHRRADAYEGRHRRIHQVRAAGRRALRQPAAAVLLASIGIGAVAMASGSTPNRPVAEPATGIVVADELWDRSDGASRSMARSVQPPSPSAVPKPAAAPSTKASTPAKPKVTTAKPKPTPTKAANPVPVGGLDQVQMNHAATIVRVGQQLALPVQAYVIAIATAIQESDLYNIANEEVPESLDYPHDGASTDYDSVGLFQQRTSTGWGTIAELMDPATSARKFYQALTEIDGWQGMALTEAAQAVQGSAFPDAYAQHESLATLIVDALT